MAKAKKPNYFKLPFEACFLNTSIYCYELYADSYDPKSFSDVKAICVKHGTSYGPKFLCSKNTGKELKACIDENLGSFVPAWLTFQGDDDQSIDYETFYRVEVVKGEVRFVEDEDFDSDQVNPTGIILEIFDANGIVDSLILDSDESCLKVCTSGYPEDAVNSADEEQQSVFDEAKLEKLEDGPYPKEYTDWELVSEWLKDVFVENFPNEKKLKLAKDSLL
jgi:hypothetical protein